MGDSSSDESIDDWVFYKDRVEWHDIQPIPQNDGPVPVVSIAYTDKFKDVYDYFRAVLVKREMSERALKLCADAAALNPANYTVWRFRREILKHLNCDLLDELQYVSDVMEDYPKNYQVWHHRRVIVEWLNDGFDELAFTATFLKRESKNYHAWQHRQWVVSKFNLYDCELEYVDQLIDEDVRNNSAWNHRYFVVSYTTGYTPEVLQREIDYSLEAISLTTFNESPWNYLRGILEFSKIGLNEPKVIKHCNDLYQNNKRSVHLQSFIVDATIDSLESDSDNFVKLQLALKLLNDLANKHDVIRVKYWKSMAADLKVQYGDLLEKGDSLSSES